MTDMRHPLLRSRTVWALALLWLAFVVRGAWYCAVLPVWEGYDEPYHFAALQHVASGQGLPHSDTPISLEVEKSLHLLPLPWELQFQAIPPPLTTHDDFWKLPPVEREQRIDTVRSLDPREGMKPAIEPVLNYEAQQAPLYYWLFAIPMRWMSAASLLSRIYWLRGLNLLLASAAIPLAYWMAKRVLCSEWQALSATAIIVLLPELMINVARVSNESLALFCYTAMLAAATLAVSRPQSWLAWLVMGGALGCGLLSKAYVLSAVPAVFVVAALALASPGPKDRYRSWPLAVLLRVAAAMSVATAIAGAWYVRVHGSTGSWTGVKDEVAVSHLSLLQKLAEVPHADWKSGILSITVSHVWFGAWSFLRLPNFLYEAAFLVIVLAMAGVVLRLLRSHPPATGTNGVLALSAFYVCFWAGLAYDVLVNFLSHGVAASTGWYLYAAVAAEVVLLAWGLQTFLPGRLVFPLLAFGAAGLDLYGMHALLMPYYSGLTTHQQGRVSPALTQTTAHLHEVFLRLSQTRQEWLTAPGLAGLWIAYWIATSATVLTVFAFARKRRAGE